MAPPRGVPSKSSATRRGNGAGHGGSARGAGKHGTRPAYTADSPTRMDASDLNDDPEAQAHRAAMRRDNRTRRIKAWDALDALVDDPAHPAHFSATRETLNRLDGMPVQPTITAAVNDIARLTDADIAAELARLEREAAALIDGTTGEAVQE